MAELVIRCPGAPEQVLLVTEKPITIGRSDECTVFVTEKKASRKHLTVRQDREGRVVADDHDSSNGTWFVAEPETRILRRVLEIGDTLRIGDTTIALRNAAPAALGGLIGGTLQLTPSAPASSMAAAPAVEATETAARVADTPPWERSALETGRGAPSDRAGITRGLLVIAVAALGFLAVEVWLGAKAKKASGRKDAHLEALRALEKIVDGADAFQRERDEFAARFPNDPRISTLDRYLEKLRDREAYEHRKEDEVNILLGQLTQIPRSEARFRLLQLRRELPGNEEFAQKIRRGLDRLDQERREEDLGDCDRLEREVGVLVARGHFGQAQRLLRAFDLTHEAMHADVKSRWRTLDERVQAGSAEANQRVWETVAGEADPARQRAILAQAWPGLAGTRDGERIAERLRSAAA
ncbi:MAG: FHA domain-containing protein, partial [Planctomycetota bacterium]|nr:FHA domain-containing protein [Planctomycetota bacterium]